MAKALGIGGVFFKSVDPQKLTAWYAQYLGLSIDDFGGVRFLPESLPIGAATVWCPFHASTEYFRPSLKELMLNFIVDDLEAALLQVQQGGARLIGGIESYDYGRFGWFVDPEGNKIELWQPKRVDAVHTPEIASGAPDKRI
jgi:predicted enzyme related to lactoylglutathione lyase